MVIPSFSMLPRATLEDAVRRALGRSRGVVLAGPRQGGKSTLAQRFLRRDSPNYFDLEYPPHAQRLAQPVQVLEGLQQNVQVFFGRQPAYMQNHRVDDLHAP